MPLVQLQPSVVSMFELVSPVPRSFSSALALSDDDDEDSGRDRVAD